MAVNKVEKRNGQVLIDLSTDTFVSADQLALGVIGHTADGEIVTGTLVPSTGGGTNVYSVDNGDGTQTLVIDGDSLSQAEYEAF